GSQLFADYVLRYNRDFKLAVVEAKKKGVPADTGLQQAQAYAEMLGVKFAYATNGLDIIEFDFLTGVEKFVDRFPTPDELWHRLNGNLKLDDEATETLLTPYDLTSGKTPRYYQEIAINRAVEGMVQGKKRLLITMATGTGKTFVAFQICRKLWVSRWNLEGAYRRPKILYLADRNILVDDPKDKTFEIFGDARHKIESSGLSKGRDIYFATYQTMINFYREYPADFFDLVIVDECHRGSARDDSLWREILDYFSPACQLGMTATPLRDETRDTYKYFGNPIYTYSLRQGIADGFLAPYRVHRIITDYDAFGWRPDPGQLDRYGRVIPDEEYQTGDFHRAVFLKAHTRAVAKHITEFLKKTDRMNKTIVFCVDQEHAAEMRRQLRQLNQDLVRQYPNYITRITSDEGKFGKTRLDEFTDVDRDVPTIVTTSKLLTTGVDVPTCKNIVIARVVNSMVEFKQIIGRGTRLRDDYGKLVFDILDYTKASRLFEDPEFDGDPARITEEQIDSEGNTLAGTASTLMDEAFEETSDLTGFQNLSGLEDEPQIREDRPYYSRKYYVDEGQVEIVAHLVYELDPQGNRLKMVKYTDYTAAQVRTLYPTAVILREQWSDPHHRQDLLKLLEDRGIDLDHLREVTSQPEADPFDLLCHLAFNAPLRTRRERAARVRQNKPDFFEQYGPLAQAVLNDLLDKYTDYGLAQFTIPDILKVPPISDRGSLKEIADSFSGPQQLRAAVNTLQQLIYE
ncbi:MAG: DEAD/DEAH box helicase family protein, partial [Anaerolineae bacterium]|nr:DEAD/DEAH box helicase family protein [Anaerolineae bacterium]